VCWRGCEDCRAVIFRGRDVARPESGIFVYVVVEFRCAVILPQVAQHATEGARVVGA